MARLGRRQHFPPKVQPFNPYVQFVTNATYGVVASDDTNDDPDNLADIGVTWALAYKREYTLLAALCSSQNVYGAPCLQATLNGYYQAPIPVGAYKGSAVAAGGNGDNYALALRNQFQPTATRADYENGVTTLRRILAGAPRNSVKILEGGFLPLISDFLKSGADSISTLSGVDLAGLYAKELIFTGMYFDGTPEPYNVQMAPTEADYVFKNWPKTVPITVVPLNLGDTVFSKPTSVAANPISYGFTNYGAGYLNGGGFRQAWHQLALLYAARGLSTFFTYANQNGTISINTGTFVTTFSASPNSNHRYLGFSGSPATTLGNIFTFWLGMAPAVIEPATTIFLKRNAA
jgi:hypothetical protein